MKFQLLATVLIASVASNPIAAANKQNSVVHRPLYADDTISNFGSSDQYDSADYEVSQLGEEDSLEEQNLEYENNLTELFTQIEGLNSLLEEGGDNFDLWGTIKSAAKGIWGVAKKVIF
ncbi:hypothetical protein CONCODRAFT_12122 [Conidiobolus coronatus NRRL 28638]|uniref:Uncharacterized protein n=1 Tax=Conidiobolus coronatus (strain ATCC 28846 / CBS 209.66 / NRRL 28638) TaxID=796925 RepID=A0A137NTH2_CONC2|nr:hypothetical protein CONCODRAFT_12122 [Conidiobolus coronatus NRRL 28638]|eukprot:KXN66105.1 hypothetical protein CONCODRAFT_12122 [Conidiobolus coronatus NRRL 28638]